MTTATQKLLIALKAVNYQESEIMINSNNKKYYFEDYKSSYKNTPNFIVNLFDKAVKENNSNDIRSFCDDGYSFGFVRSQFKNQKHGIITYTKLIKC